MELRGQTSAVVGDDRLVAEHDAGVSTIGVAADVAVAAEDRRRDDGLRPIQPFGQTIEPSIDRVLLDVALPADDGVGPDPRAGLDDRALVDEAGALDSSAPSSTRASGDTQRRGRRRVNGGAE